MSQKFRVKQVRIKSELADRSGLVTENMTSATPDKEVGTTFKNVLVDENGEFVVGPESSGGSICNLDQVTQPQADTLGLEDLRVTVCGTGDVDIDGKTVSLDKVAGLFGGAGLAPIMGGAGTTIANNISSTGADLTGNITSNNGSPIIQNGFVIYLSGNPTYEIGTSGVTSQTATTVQSGNITLSATGLLGSTNYCIRPYAINVDGISYGIEVCFTTLATPANGKLVIGTNFVNETTGAIAFTCPHAVDQVIFHNGYTYVRGGSTVYSYDALNNLIDTQAGVNYMVIMNNMLFTNRYAFFIPGPLFYNHFIQRYNLVSGNIVYDTEIHVNTIGGSDHNTYMTTATWGMIQCGNKIVFGSISGSSIPHYYVIDPVTLSSSIKVNVAGLYTSIGACSYDQTKVYFRNNNIGYKPIQEMERDTGAISPGNRTDPLSQAGGFITANNKISSYYGGVQTNNAIINTPTMTTLGTPLFTGRYGQSIYPGRNYEFMLTGDCVYTVWYQSGAGGNGGIRKQSLSTGNSVGSFTTTHTGGLGLVTDGTLIYSLNGANVEVRTHSALSLSATLPYSGGGFIMGYRG